MPRKRIAPIRWKARNPQGPPKPRGAKSVIKPTQRPEETKPKRPKNAKMVRRPSTMKPGKLVNFRYKRPWAWDPNPVVFVLYAEPRYYAFGGIEGINVRYANRKYWEELEKVIDRYPYMDAEFIYNLLKVTNPDILKAYRRYRYDRIATAIYFVPHLSEAKAIRRLHTKFGEFIK